MKKTISGGCLCGGVRYRVTGRFLRAGHCHCPRCRKHSGAAVCTQGRVRREDFKLLSGAKLIRSFRPGDGAVKAFCRICGSSLFGGTWPKGDEVSIRLGTIEGDPGIRPQYHTFVALRAPWDKIHDKLPRYKGAYPNSSAKAAHNQALERTATGKVTNSRRRSAWR